MTEIFVEARGARLCTESFGDPALPPLLLIMGLGGSMLWWPDDLCRALTAAGLFVVRYDHRDTGRSTACEPGEPGYDSDDLVADAVAVLDGRGIRAAHLVGVSAGGAIAQRLALDAPQRVLSLTLISSSPAVETGRDLPPPEGSFIRFVTEADVEWSQPGAVLEHLVGYARVLAGDRRPFDEAACRELVRREMERSVAIASLQNHDIVAARGGPVHGSLGDISVPTLVIHGTADPLFPLEHGRVLADSIPHAALFEIAEAGHGVEHRDRDAIARAVVDHVTAPPATAHGGPEDGRG